MGDELIAFKGFKTATPDFYELREQGIKLLQQMAGDVWTDYNLHDPGVTILEQLCFALTDLFYRTGFPIEDLICNENGEINYLKNSFFEKQKILSTSAVTVNDFCKVLIDELEDVDKVWIEPVTSKDPDKGLKGLYRFFVQVDQKLVKTIDNHRNQEEVKEKVRKCFVAHRNLCEDASSEILILEPQKVKVLTRVTINGSVLPEIMLARIVRAIENFLNPPIKRFTEKELLDKNYSIDSIYNGPLLKNGIIPDDELVARRHSIDPLELVREIAALPGIIAVHSLSIDDKGKPLQIEDLKFPLLDMEQSLPGIEMYLNDYKLIVPYAAYRGQLVNIRQMAKRDFVKSFNDKEEKIKGNYRNTREYYSIQNFFPAIYGLGEEGISGLRTPLLLAQAKQLKGYLMLFEQLMADYLTQLDGVDDLYSNEINSKSINHRQPLYNVPGAADILIGDQEGNLDWEKYKRQTDNAYVKALKTISNGSHDYAAKKEKLLDHMLGRFNELLVSYPVKLYTSLYNPALSDHSEVILKWKSDILKNISDQSYSRCRAFNYLSTKKKSTSYNFHKRMCELLYIKNDENTRLTSAFTSVPKTLVKEKASKSKPQKSDKTLPSQSPENEFNLTGAKVKGLIDEGTLIYPKDLKTSEFRFNIQDETLLYHGINKANFQIAPDVTSLDKDTYLIIYTQPQEQLPTVISVCRTYEQAVQNLEDLINYFSNISIKSEGFYMVEHILLRPHDVPFVHDILPDTFYNFRLSVIFPSWPARFQEKDFVECAKNLFLLNSPAHLKLDFYCLDIIQMTEFEQHYFDFLKVLHSKDRADNAASATKLAHLLNKYLVHDNIE